jgi:hypothetical protein
MTRLALVLGAVLLGGGGPQQGVSWMKLEQARVVASKTGRPLAILVAVDPKSGNAACGRSTGTDKAFGDASLDRWKEKLLFSRVTDKRTAEELKATRCLELLFVAFDGEEVHRSAFSDLESLERDLALVVKRTTPRAPEWATMDAKQAAPGARPIVLFVVDDRKESQETLKALEERELATLHEKVSFARLAWKKDSEEAKRWGAAQAPTIVVLDPADRDVLEKATGKKTARELKALILKALAKVEPKTEKK